MTTTDDLRRVLADRAEQVSTGRPSIEAAIDAGRRQRARGRVALGAVAIATATVVVTCFLWLRPDADVTLPADTAPPSREWIAPNGDVWTPEVPGLELPLGAALAVPYLWDGVLYIDGHELRADELTAAAETGAQFLAVPQGVVTLAERLDHPSFPRYARLLLIHSDGVVETLDSGAILGVDAARQPDGSVLVAYGWMESATSEESEIRVLELGSGDPPRTFQMNSPVTIQQPYHGTLLSRGLVELESITEGSDWPSAVLDISTGDVHPKGAPGYVAGMINAAGDRIVSNANNDCFSATRPDGSTAWQRCDNSQIIDLSPDGLTLATLGGMYDARTGERLAPFSLPQPDESAAAVIYPRVVGWESNESFLIDYGVWPAGTEDIGFATADRHVMIRCSTATGQCDRVPHPVDSIGRYAR